MQDIRSSDDSDTYWQFVEITLDPLIKHKFAFLLMIFDIFELIFESINRINTKITFHLTGSGRIQILGNQAI